MKIGVVTVNLHVGWPACIQTAAQIGAEGVSVRVNGEELRPDLTAAEAEEVRELVARHGLILASTCGEVGGFAQEEHWQQRLDTTLRCLQASALLGAPVMTAHVGVIPEDREHPTWRRIFQALQAIGEVCEKVQVKFAIETGPEHPAVLRDMLERLGNPYVGVNFDPANLVMRGWSPQAGVRILREYIFHTHAKDGRCLSATSYKELPLGEGDVCYPLYLQALQEIGFDGFLAIERETGNDRVGDMRRGIEFLRRELANLPPLPRTSAGLA
ncbi:MAG: sugar phosphate isomerase/epimerase [Limnochordales bacterium]|nr:sugar phosphate isomerase/epimerase [Limnochordales bacterium]